ncbi:MAG: hypothetical protein VX733_00695 [Candidatus Latescibacterota bacterium]|nr:hypothetical protein [Candidatus Latescibacterota bacterium]
MSVIAILDRIAQFGLAGAVALMLQPWWREGFRYGFFATLLFVVFHIFTSHAVARGNDSEKMGSEE